jgi:hypothetical protein
MQGSSARIYGKRGWAVERLNELSFELASFGTSSDPIGAEGIYNFGDIIFFDEWRRKRNEFR